LSNVVAIAAGDFHTLALRADGSVIGWGDDSYGQTNVPSTLINVVAIASGNYHGLALLPAIPWLQWQVTSGGLVLQWRGTAVLQWAPFPSGPYTDVPCQGNGYTNVDMSAPAKFFRLRLTPAIPALQWQMTSGGLVLRWPGSGILQWAPMPAGPYTDVPCQGNCYTNVDMSATAKFFRLRL
jgi:hypothetical protein